ncbi:MAG: biotin/lipoyl-binding protein [Planctomycetota bacterium]
MDTDELEFGSSEEVADVMVSRPPRWLGFSILLFGVGLVCALIVAYVGTVEVVVTVPQGIVRPAGDVVWIEPIVAGRLLTVNAREGDQVVAGQILFRMDARDASTELRKAQNRQGEVREQLRSKRRACESLEREDRAAHERERLELDGARLALAKSDADRERAAAALRESDAHVLEARANHDPSQQLFTSGLVTEAELRLLKARLDIAIAERDKAQMDLHGAEVDAEVAENRVPTLEAAAAESRERRSRELEETQVGIAELEAEINRLLLEEQGLRSLCGDFELHAPVSGTITSVSKRAAGQYVEAGDRLAAIAPEGVPWVVETFIPDRDAGLPPRSSASRVRLPDAFPYRDYGVLWDSSKIDPDTTWHEQLGRVYRAVIGLDSLELRQGHRVGTVRLGMQATAEIVKERERILTILLRRARDGVAME